MTITVKKAKSLTANTVKNAKPHAERQEIPDPACRGLYLIIQPSGVKSWAARFRYLGRSIKLTLGPVLIGAAESNSTPEMGAPLSLAHARELCARVLREAQAGNDPTQAKAKRREQQHAAKADTLQAVAEEFLRRVGPSLRTLNQRKADLELLTKSVLGRQPIAEIKRTMFVREFDRISDDRGPVRANRVQMAVKRLLNWHSDRSDYISVLMRTKALISISDRARSHIPSDAEIKAIVLAAEQDQGMFGRYLLFTLLTACRRGESAALRRSELSPDGRTWTIPGSKYKNGKDHVIPLSAKAAAIVASMPVLAGGDYVFSASGRRALNDFTRLKQRFDAACGVSGWVIHDLRRVARTLLSRAKIRPDIGEMCLGHRVGGIRGVYDKHEFIDEKREAFEALASLVERIVHPVDTVVQMSSAKPKRRK